MRLLILTLVLFSSMLSGCATNAMTGRSQLSLVSESTLIGESATMYSALVEDYDQKGKICTDPAINERVQKISNRLVERAVLYRPEVRDWQWQVNVVEAPDVINASCMPGGKIVVYTGLLEKVQPTDDELAEVMGHEISHALANHGAEKRSTQILGQIAVAAVTVAVIAADKNANQSQRNQDQALAMNASALAAAAFITLPNSRGAETEADKLGIELAAQAGYDPAAALTFWQKMAAANDQHSRGDFWSTHPSPPNRIDALTALQDPMNHIYQERKAVYPEGYTPAVQYVHMGKDGIMASSNVRVINEGASSLSAEAAPAPGAALAFYSPQYEAFKQGALIMTCTSCGMTFFFNESDFKKLYDAQDWRGLMQGIAKADYKIDLSYLYLGFAAQGMGLVEPAKHYFAQALELADTEEFSCAKATMIKCNDLDVKTMAAKSPP